MPTGTDVLANISPALSQTFAPDIVRAYNREAVLGRIIPFVSDDGQGDAKQVAWDVSFSGASAQAFAEGSDVQVGEPAVDVDVPATLSWGQYRSVFYLSNLNINAATRTIAGGAALVDMVGHRTVGAATKLASVINTDLWTGTGTASNGNPNIIGFTGTPETWNGALISSGTYATLATATYPEWASNLLTNGGTFRPLSFALLSQLERQIFINSGRTPSVIVTTAGIASKYENLFEGAQRWMNEGGSGGVQLFAGSIGAGMDGMNTNMMWRNIPVIRDRNAPTGSLLMLDLEYVEGKYLPFAPLSPDGIPVTTFSLPSSDGKAGAPTPMIATLYNLGRTGSAVKFVLEIYLQLAVKRTNAQGLLADLSEV